ncbi:ubiquitin-conjugating enzyme/RWD-like protein [Protomyces lactucae-debilis]|uniref:E2 ubiquitin-conjugating enzyme n=1 Tax=Protomyces lactucae-debilis TaxID=2754530 RepID=A0A1Y2FNC6_PROLT|nr:ubiquitin-conjugating enzyme/RWD-like protein [Protomyces lactucae-debilis]ORY85473.1 ubiquitin-conjugating enzyme/RWD-like protein [Protomyces lactucae-debilis]
MDGQYREKNTPSPNASSSLILKRQFRDLQKHPVQGFSCGLPDESNFYEWEVLIIGPQDTVYEGAFLKARLTFPREYPLLPPKMQFLTEMWHPNIYADGNVCISILHAPEDDQYGYEDAGERWLPVHTVETVLISVISMLSSPNDESPANLPCAQQLREDPKGFKKKVRALVRKSGEDAFD